MPDAIRTRRLGRNRFKTITRTLELHHPIGEVSIICALDSQRRIDMNKKQLDDTLDERQNNEINRGINNGSKNGDIGIFQIAAALLALPPFLLPQY